MWGLYTPPQNVYLYAYCTIIKICASFRPKLNIRTDAVYVLSRTHVHTYICSSFVVTMAAYYYEGYPFYFKVERLEL